MYKIKFLSPILLILFAACTSRASEFIYVDASGPNAPGTGSYDDPFQRIQDAIEDPNTRNGDIIEIQLGIYSGEGNYDLDPCGLALTVRSTNPDDPIVVAGTIIDPQGAGRGFSFTGGIGNTPGKANGMKLCGKRTSKTFLRIWLEP